jgi:hypothetical protein
MTPEELRRDEANRWLAQARKDLNAAHLLSASEPSRSVLLTVESVAGRDDFCGLKPAAAG